MSLENSGKFETKTKSSGKSIGRNLILNLEHTLFHKKSCVSIKKRFSILDRTERCVSSSLSFVTLSVEGGENERERERESVCVCVFHRVRLWS